MGVDIGEDFADVILGAPPLASAAKTIGPALSSVAQKTTALITTPPSATSTTTAAKTPASSALSPVAKAAQAAKLPTATLQSLVANLKSGANKGLSVGQRAVNAGQKLAKKHPKQGNKVVALGQKALAHGSNTAVKAATASTAASSALSNKGASHMLSGLSRVILGVGDQSRDDDGSATLLSINMWSTAIQAIADLVEALNEMQPNIDALNAKQGTASVIQGFVSTVLGLDQPGSVSWDGQNIMTDALNIINRMDDPSTLDLDAWSAMGVATLIDDAGKSLQAAQTWQNKAQAALGQQQQDFSSANVSTAFTTTKAPPPPPGTPGTPGNPATTPAPGMPWQPNTTYPVGSTVVNTAGNMYSATSAGVSAPMGGPMAIMPGMPVQDGTVWWMYTGGAAGMGMPGGGYGGGYGGGGGGDDSGGGGGGGGGSQGGDGGLGDDDSSMPGYSSASRDVAAQMDADGGGSPGDDGGGDDMPGSPDGDPLADGDDNVQGVVSSAPFAAYQYKLSADQQALVDASKARLAQTQAALAAQRGMPTAAAAQSQFQLTPSATFADRLAEASQSLQSALNPDQGDGDGSDQDPTLQGAIVLGHNESHLEVDGDDLLAEPMTVNGQQIKEAFDDAAVDMSADDLITNVFAGMTSPMPLAQAPVSDDLECGRDIMGAGVPKSVPKKRAVWTAKTTPGGNQIISQTPIKPKVGDHKKSIANARDVAKRAVKVGDKLAKAVAAGKTKPAIAVHGVVTPGKHTRKRLHPAQIKKLADIAIKAGKGLSGQADKHQQHVDSTVAAIKAGVTKGRTMIHGTGIYGLTQDQVVHRKVAELLGADAVYRSIVGQDTTTSAFFPAGGATPASMVPAQAPAIIDPNTGLPVGQSIDPNTGLPLAPGQLSDTVSTDSSIDPNAVLTDPNAGQGPIPTLDSIGPPPFTAGPDPLTDQTPYTSLPEGAIVMDWSQTGDNPVGSFNFFHGKGNPPPGFRANTERGHWYAAWGGWSGDVDDWGDRGFMGFVDWPPNNIPRIPGNASAQDVQKDSLLAGWGPLIGNPGHTATNKLHYDSGGDQYFWFYNDAPDWAKAPGDQLRLQQAITDWQANVTAAKTDAASQAAQDQLDAESAAALQKQQASEDAAMARQQDQESKQSAHDADLQATADTTAAARQATADAAQQKADSAQADIDRQAATAQADIDRQNAQAQADIDDRRAAAALAAAQQQAAQQTDGGGQDPSGAASDDSYMDHADQGSDDSGDQFTGVAGLKRRLGIR